MRARIREAAAGPGVRAVVLDAETMPLVDVSAVRMLDELSDVLRGERVQLLMARDVGQVRDVLRRAGGDPSLTRVYPTVDAAIRAALGDG